MHHVLPSHGVTCDIVHDGVAEDALQCVPRVEIARTGADYDRELGLRVDTSIVRADLDFVEMSQQAAAGLQEEHGMFGGADFAGVRGGVVHRHAYDLSRP